MGFRQTKIPEYDLHYGYIDFSICSSILDLVPEIYTDLCMFLLKCFSVGMSVCYLCKRYL
jgi:hypothetical protein